jgi:large conductance mechanosensitive channel
MSLMNEFKTFAVKGNAIDLAVGVIIGAAFGKIVESLVNDITMPLIARLIGGKFDFSNLFFILGEVPAGTATTLDALRKAGVPVFAWGSFVTIVINFILMAFVIFLLVRYLNRIKDSVLAAATPTASGASAPTVAAAETPPVSEAQAAPLAAAPLAAPSPSPTEVLLAEIRDELRRRP